MDQMREEELRDLELKYDSVKVPLVSATVGHHLLLHFMAHVMSRTGRWAQAASAFGWWRTEAFTARTN